MYQFNWLVHKTVVRYKSGLTLEMDLVGLLLCYRSGVCVKAGEDDSSLVDGEKLQAEGLAGYPAGREVLLRLYWQVPTQNEGVDSRPEGHRNTTCWYLYNQ